VRECDESDPPGGQDQGQAATACQGSGVFAGARSFAVRPTAVRGRVQVVVVAVVFAVVGVVIGLLSPVTIPTTYARYTAVALLAVLAPLFAALLPFPSPPP